MNNFLDMLKQLNPEPESDVQIPLAPQSPIPVDYNALAQEEALQQAVPARAPALGSNNEQAISRGPASDVSIKSTSKSMNSGSAPVVEDAEERLERMMRELNEERNREREDAASRQMKANIFKAITDNVGNIVGGAQAMNTKASVNPVQVKGFDPGDLIAGVDKKFSGDREALLDQYKQLLNARDKSEQRKYQQDSLKIQRDGLALKKQALDNKPTKLTVGQESADRDYGKRYNEWTTTGRAKVDTNLNKLEEVAKILENLPESKRTSDDRFYGRLHDSLRSEKDINMREDVRSAAQESLRSTLGSQFTEKEGEAIMKRAYDDTLSPETNAKRIRTVITELTKGRDANDAKAKQFETKGSLVGQKLAGERAPASKPKTVKQGDVTYTLNEETGEYE